MLEERVASWPKQWMAEGYKEGQRMALKEQAEEKFGALEPRYADLIEKASENHLRQWLKDILTAATPGDLFRV